MPTVTSLKTSFQAQIAPGDATEFLRILTEADMRLLEYGRWRWTRGRDTLTPVSGYVTLPTTYASILGARVGKNAVEIRDEDYEFVPGGVGEVDLGTGHSRLIDQGLVEIADPASFASVTINPTGADNSFTLTAVEAGEDGNDITFAMVMADVDEPAVEVVADAITVTAATYDADEAILISGTLTDGTSPVIFPVLLKGTDGFDTTYSDNGSAFPPSDGTHYLLQLAFGIWQLTITNYIAGAPVTGSIWDAADGPADPTAATGWAPNAPATGTPSLSFLAASTAQQVIDAINADPEASALALAAASGTVTGAVAAVDTTSLSGGENMQVRRYKVAGYLADDDVVTALMHYAPVTLYDPAIADSMTPDDATVNTRCPDATALKLMMLGIVCEEASDREGARSFIADALRSLDGKEQSQRGNATRTINSRPMGLNIRRIRGWR